MWRVAIGERIKKLRKAAGILQIDFAAAVGVSPSVACEWESGVYDPSLARLPSIAAALGVTVLDLMSLTPVLPPEPPKGGRKGAR